MLQSGPPLVINSVSYQGLPKVLGTHRPTSSAESSDSPTGLFANSCSGFAQSFNMHVDPAAALIAAAPSADPVQAIRQGLSQLAPAQLAELQAVLRQQRLERQQQDLLPILSRQPSAAPPMYSSPYVAPCSTIGAAPSNRSMLAPTAAVPAPLAHNGRTAHGDAAQSALLQNAAAHLLQQLVKSEQLNSTVQLSAAVAPLAMPAAEPQYQQQHYQQQQVQPQQQWQEAWQWQHPGVTASRSARNTWRRRGNWHTALASLKRRQQRQQQDEAVSTANLHSDSTTVAAARTGRFAPEVTDALWQQLQQLEQEEQACHKASAQAAQRRSGRARKGRRDWDTTNNASSDVRGSPDPAVSTAAAAAAAVAVPSDAAASAERAGSADSTGANNASVSILLQHSDADASKQHQRKRVRFAIADDVDSQQEEQTEEEEELRPKVVRRIGVRAQARKRMHKRTARRRRPMRAPLN